MFASFSHLASGAEGQPHTTPALDLELIAHDNAVLRYAAVREEYAGPFNRHFVASLPFGLEEQCRFGAGLLDFCSGNGPTASVYTLGDGPGVTARALSSASDGRISTLTCSPNPENHVEFDKKRPRGAFFFARPFFDLTVERRRGVGGGAFGDGFDVIVEDTTFQMYGPERAEPIALAIRHLKDDGLFIAIEKLAHCDRGEFLRREQQKDEVFKRRFFSAGAIEGKRNAIVLRMDSQLVTLATLTEAMSRYFSHCVVTWNSGNFYTVAASNSDTRLRAFVRALIPPAIPPEFLYESLPLPISPTPHGGATGVMPYRFRQASP